MYPNDTIVASATAPGKSGIGVLRVSGPLAKQISKMICGKDLQTREATNSGFYSASKELIDSGISIFFTKPNSYTGEDVLELQGHGGFIVQKLLLDRCVELGARPAEAGEFTKRAFLNGKMDLIQAENVAQLINANTQMAVRSANRALQGESSKKVKLIANQLINLRAKTEVQIDFSDEEIPEIPDSDFMEELKQTIFNLERLVINVENGQILQQGLKVVIFGEPNVGKSTIFNRLLENEMALVTDIPGTTRDCLIGHLEIEGLPIQLIDTAGIRESRDFIEQLGIKKTREELKTANMVLHVKENESSSDNSHDLRKELEQGVELIEIINKSDLKKEAPKTRKGSDVWRISISAKNDKNMDLLKKTIFLALGSGEIEDSTFMASGRQVSAIKGALEHLKRGLGVVQHVELLAEELRMATNELGLVTGEVCPDDILGEIFAKFCIGK